MLLSLLPQTFQSANRIPIDLDHIEKAGARCPKGVEMNESMLAIFPYWVSQVKWWP